MAGEVKHRELTDLAPHLSDPAHFLKNFSSGVKETPAFSSTIFMAGDHHMEKTTPKCPDGSSEKPISSSNTKGFL